MSPVYWTHEAWYAFSAPQLAAGQSNKICWSLITIAHTYTARFDGMFFWSFK